MRPARSTTAKSARNHEPHRVFSFGVGDMGRMDEGEDVGLWQESAPALGLRLQPLSALVGSSMGHFAPAPPEPAPDPAEQPSHLAWQL